MVMDAGAMDRLNACTNAITRWHLKNGQLLNQTKIEALATGTRQQLAKFTNVTGVTGTGISIPFSNILMILGVTLYEKLIFVNHISNVVMSCNYHRRALGQIRPFNFKDMANIHSMINSRLYYGNVVLYGVTSITFSELKTALHGLNEL